MPAKPAIVKDELPMVDDYLALMEADHEGLEEATAEDFALPFISIVEALSPQRKKTDDKFIEGAEEGMIFNSVTRHLYGDAVQVIPCYYKKSILEWKTRDNGGGFVAEHPGTSDVRDNCLRDDRNRLIDPVTEHEMVVTGTFFVLVNEGDGIWNPAIVSMAKTRFGCAKRWNTLMNMRTHPEKHFKLPPAAQVYTLKPSETSNDQGSWHIWDMNFDRVASGPEYKAAVEFREIAKSANIKVVEDENPDDEAEVIREGDDAAPLG